MKVFKFGGASIKDAAAINNLKEILKKEVNQSLVVVISAIDKTTNCLETVVKNIIDGNSEKALVTIEKIKNFHFDITTTLFPENHLLLTYLEDLFKNIIVKATSNYTNEYELYDRIVSYGEILSTKIISTYLSEKEIENEWLAVGDFIITNSDFKNAKVCWENSADKIKTLSKNKLYITQGFTGCDKTGAPTTLGREGSDFSAAIFAYCLNAESVTVWKDVEGILNADPKKQKNTVKFNKLSYSEVIELSYYGASVIHPKTIKPLENKNIPLYVKSFLNPDKEGTLIFGTDENQLSSTPSIIIKEAQTLVSFSIKDFSFIDEQILSKILQVFSSLNIKINLIQNSAITVSIVYDSFHLLVNKLNKMLGKEFIIKYNTKLTLYTIRHYNESVIKQLIKNESQVLLSQKSRLTAQFVIKS